MSEGVGGSVGAGAEPLWRITVDSWISPDANWYGRRVFFIAANSLPEAMQRTAELTPEQYLAEDGLELMSGDLSSARNDHRIWRRNNRKRRNREERSDV